MRALVLGLMLVAGSARATPAQPGPLDAPVDATLAKQVQGCWDLGMDYRIWLTRAGHGLSARQATHRQHRRVTITEPVRFNPADGTLVFEGMGRIHRTVVVLRWNQGLEAAFSAEIGRGKWTGATYSPATSCPIKR